MEPIIFQDSPLAQYLEGEGEACHEWAIVKSWEEPEPDSFAPRRPSTLRRKLFRKVPNPAGLVVLAKKGMVTRIQQAFSAALRSRFGWTENSKFLERFRYIIVASQLLSDNQSRNIYNRQVFPPQPAEEGPHSEKELNATYSWLALFMTFITPFSLVYSMHRVISAGWTYPPFWQCILCFLPFTVFIWAVQIYVQQQKLQALRLQALENASSIIATAQNFDAAALATITIVQEVELVSRGYRISSPLPPVSRIEDQHQIKSCTRLRHSLYRALKLLHSPYVTASQSLLPHVVDLDLEKYYDIYEISQSDVDLAADVEISKNCCLDDVGNIIDLKAWLEKLRIVRRVFFCSLLALDAGSGKSDYPRWIAAIEIMKSLSTETARATDDINEVLQEEDEFPLPSTPKIPFTPGRERLRVQLRKLSSLSQGIRGLQAKMHLLRDESERLVDEADDNLLHGQNLLMRYDSVGEDLKDLLKEWEQNRAILASNIDKRENRKSLPSLDKLRSLSPTQSLGGLTAVDGSPPNGLLSFHGSSSSRSRSNSAVSSSSNEVFEAVAQPRQRSVLSREERLAKMKEERAKQAVSKGKAEANTNMLKELEMVIKLRPRGHTTGRVTSM